MNLEEFQKKYKPNTVKDFYNSQCKIFEIEEWILNFYKIKDNYNKLKKKSLEKSCLIISGPHGSGKSCMVDFVLKRLNLSKKDFNLINVNRYKKEVINESIFYDISITKPPIFIIDDLEILNFSTDKKNITLEIIKMNLKKWITPLIIISNGKHSKFISKIKKLVNIININKPNEQDILNLLHKIYIKEKLKFTQNSVLKIIVENSKNDYRKFFSLVFELTKLKTPISEKIINKCLVICIPKNIDLDIYTITEKIFNGNEDINEILRYYDSGKVLIPLMIHQNFQSNLNNINLEYKISKLLSFGDIIENYIYNEQNWDLQNIHGIISCVIPSYIFKNGKNIKKNLEFPTDLNKTSNKKMNKKNIIKLKENFKDFEIEDLLELNKIIQFLMKNKRYNECIDLVSEYKNKDNILDSLFKINKLKDYKITTQTLLYYKKRLQKN